MVTSDFRPDVKIWPFSACAVKNTHYNRYYMNSSVIVDSAMWQIPRSTDYQFIYFFVHSSDMSCLVLSLTITRHLYLSSVALSNCSTDSPVHDVMLAFHAVLGLPLMREPGVVPCIISFSRLSPRFLIICPKYVNYLFFIEASKLLSTPAVIGTQT